MRMISALSRRLLIVMAKAPVAGGTKTGRTATGIPADAAARLAAAFLTDTIHTATNPALRASVWLALDGEARNLPPTVQDLPVYPQTGNSLGERTVSILEHGFTSGFETVCLIGSDSPHLPLAFLQEAFGRLEAGAEAVFGPTDSGGYYLAGLRRLRPELLAGVSSSASDSLAATVKAAQTAALQISVLPPSYAIETAAGVERLTTDLRRGVAVAPATGTELSIVMK